jgi:hypothetical protein
MVLGERALAAEAWRDHHLPRPHPRLDGDEVFEVIAHMLLNGRGRFQMLADLGIDLVPRTADVRRQIALQRVQCFVETLGLLLAPFRLARSLCADRLAVIVDERTRAAGAETRRRPARSRPLDDNFAHVLTHGARGLSARTFSRKPNRRQETWTSAGGFLPPLLFLLSRRRNSCTARALRRRL